VVEHVESVLAAWNVDDLQPRPAAAGRTGELVDRGGDLRALASHTGQHDRQVTGGCDRLDGPEPRVDLPPWQGGKPEETGTLE